MDNEISCDDPQFMDIFENCLRAEIEKAESTLSGLKSEVQSVKMEVLAQLQIRRELKEKKKITTENIVILRNMSDKQNKYVNELSTKIELVELNLDNEYKVMQQEYEQYKSIYDEYERTWQSYHAMYEEFPLAKIRKAEKIKLEKLRIEKLQLEYKINEFEKILKKQRQITWLRVRAKIVELARAILTNKEQEEKLNSLNRSIEDHKKDLGALEIELAARMKIREEEKRIRALKLLEMPPPKINFSHARISKHRSRTDSLDTFKIYERSIDSLSVDTLRLEEMCKLEEKDVCLASEIQDPLIVDVEERNSDDEQSIDPRRSPSLDQEQQEMEHEDAASEVNGNAASQPIDALEEEVERRMDQELEHLDQPHGVPKDKQPGQRAEHSAEEMDDPVAKRMRLTFGDEEVVASPAKDIRVERMKRRLDDPSPRPKVTNVEAVHYNLALIKEENEKKKSDLGQGISEVNAIAWRGIFLRWNLGILAVQNSFLFCGHFEESSLIVINDLAIPREAPSIEQSPSPSITKLYSRRKPEQKNPEVSSMFSSYDFDYSNISFSVNENAKVGSADEISFYQGSDRNFCACSNISTMNEDAEMEPIPKSDVKVSRPSNFDPPSKFDFGNILKRNPERNRLF
ncbi:uncharacterized protein LOC143426676 [Xylocopa sonorina]|uniref:uncharacterized protein LOC143426676 n=1 Tax=Xylocopa sonorina TaxID=1818115 RepID=UPI00403AECAF